MKTRNVSVALAVMMFAAASACTHASQETGAAAPPATAAANANDASLRAFRDPVTGKLRAPTPEELQQQQASVPAKSVVPPPRVIYQPDGSVGVFPHRRDLIRAEVRKDGSISVHDGGAAPDAHQPVQQP
ncbi:MAG: post-PEP-CTERM-1 domain-containing protein [Stenotrophobium sp.]